MNSRGGALTRAPVLRSEAVAESAVGDNLLIGMEIFVAGSARLSGENRATTSRAQPR